MKGLCIVGLLTFSAWLAFRARLEQPELAMPTSKAEQQTIRAKAKLDSTQQIWRNRIDSLKRRNPTDTILTNQLVDLNQSLDSLQFIAVSNLRKSKTKVK